MTVGGDTQEREPPGGDTYGSGRAFEAVRIRVVKRLRERRGEIEEAIFARARDAGFGLAGSDDPAYIEGLHAAVVAAVDYVLAGIELSQEEAASLPVPQTAIEQARRAARAGVRLDTVLRRYLAGYALVEGFLTQDPDLMARGTALGEVLGVTASLVDLVITAVSGAYRQESERARRLPSRSDRTPLAESQKSSVMDRSRGTLASGEHPRFGQQRERILEATVRVVAERGVAGTSVGLVIGRAKVSSRTFYELFAGLDECLVAIMEGALEQIGALVSQALERVTSWRDGVRSVLAATLALLDAEPDLARVCLVETLGASAVVVEQRERIVEAFRALVVARIESEVSHVSPLAAESVFASVMGVLRTRLITREPQSLITLLGPLMGIIVTPFVANEQMAAEEVRRGDQLARAIQTGQVIWAPLPTPADAEPKPTQPAPSARRARECLIFLAEHPDSSNLEVAKGIGVAQKSQIATLLASLLGEDLVTKRSEGPGKRNAWRLTPPGEEIARALSAREAAAGDSYL
jgi:AcrR family transcriptional regulator